MKSLWMLVATLSFAVMAACVKQLSDAYSTGEILFYRCLISAILVAMYAKATQSTLWTPYWREHGRRACFGASAMGAWYYTLGVLPLATSVTLNYASPIFVGVLTAYAALRRGDRSDQKMAYLAIAIGFGGVCLLLNPSAEMTQAPAIMIGLLGALVAALSFRDVRRLAELGESEVRMVFYFCIFAAVFAAIPMALQELHTHTRLGMLFLFVIGVCGTVGQFAVSRAFGLGHVLLSAALQYTGVVFAALIGFWVWEETLPFEKLLGIATIVFAGILSVVAAKKP